MTAAQIRAAVEARLRGDASTESSDAHSRWVWRRESMQAALDVYGSGAVGFWCQHGGGPEIRIIGQSLDVDLVLAALDLTTGANLGGITVTAEQLAAWVGRPLSPDEVDQLDEAVPNSSIPELIAMIVDSFDRQVQA